MSTNQEKLAEIYGQKQLLFVQFATYADPDVSLPATLPSIVHDGDMYFVIPAKTAVDGRWWRTSPKLPHEANMFGMLFLPEKSVDLAGAKVVNSEAVVSTIESYTREVAGISSRRDALATLAKEREANSGLFASAAPLDLDTPMLVAGLVRKRGVSVFYGDMDEFKTTLVLDMAAHIAAGAPWQGRDVKPRPVIWYALEGVDEIPLRLRALEIRTNGKGTWGDERLPITARDRIPGKYLDGNTTEWAKEVTSIYNRWSEVAVARVEYEGLSEWPFESVGQDTSRDPEDQPLLVIDTLSIALGAEDEKGPKAVGFINACLKLVNEKIVSHIFVIHHQTKTGVDFAGHRAIAANTQGLYRVHRFGQMTDRNRSYGGRLTPMRVKGVPRPAPVDFEVEIVPVGGTEQKAAILKAKTGAVLSEDLKPVLGAIAESVEDNEISPADLNDCLDIDAAKDGREGSTRRGARKRLREKLETAGVIEPVLDDAGRVKTYRFHSQAT